MTYKNLIEIITEFSSLFLSLAVYTYLFISFVLSIFLDGFVAVDDEMGFDSENIEFIYSLSQETKKQNLQY